MPGAAGVESRPGKPPSHCDTGWVGVGTLPQCPPTVQLIPEPGVISTRVTSPTAKYYRETHFLLKSVLGNEAISMILNQHIPSIQLLGLHTAQGHGHSAGKPSRAGTVVANAGPRVWALEMQPLMVGAGQPQAWACSWDPHLHNLPKASWEAKLRLHPQVRQRDQGTKATGQPGLGQTGPTSRLPGPAHPVRRWALAARHP